MATPNLFSLLPVVILAWVLASTSGFTRSATRAVRPMPVAMAEIIAISSALSALIWKMSSAEGVARSRARSCRRRRRRWRAAGMPAARAMRSSPSLTTSAPRPSAASTRSTDEVVVALHGEVDGRGQPGVGQRGLQRAGAAAQRAGGIDPGGGADLGGDAGQRHLLHHQPVHGVQGQVRAQRQQLGEGGVGGVGRSGEARPCRSLSGWGATCARRVTGWGRELPHTPSFFWPLGTDLRSQFPGARKRRGIRGRCPPPTYPTTRSNIAAAGSTPSPGPVGTV